VVDFLLHEGFGESLGAGRKAGESSKAVGPGWLG
jgi:hypothetical protein